MPTPVTDPPLRRLPDVLTALAALFTGYVVVGGIWTGQATILPGTHPLALLALAGVIILAIGGLEGLQISVSNLQKKDLAELREHYSAAVVLHARFRNDDEVMKRFFGGRQFLIVGLVFVASRLTTFPAMQTFPFTDVAFPAVLTPWFQFLFLDLGLLGALFVLWLGNLTAQFVATDHPVEFLNLPGMALLFGLCVSLDTLRLPRPASWFASYLGGWLAARRTGDDDDGRAGGRVLDALPVSSEERWRRELESESGFVLTDCSHEWYVHPDRIRRIYRATYLVGREGIHTLVDDAFRVPREVPLGPTDSLRWGGYAVVGEAPSSAPSPTPSGDDPVAGRTNPSRRSTGARRGGRAVGTDGGDDDEWATPTLADLSFEKEQRTVELDGVTYVSFVLAFSGEDGDGTFEPGTRLHVEVRADLDVTPEAFPGDVFYVDHPCADLSVRVEYHGGDDADADAAVGSPVLSVCTPVHDRVPDSADCTTRAFETRPGSGGAVNSYSEAYPRVRSRYEVRWAETDASAV